MNTTVKRLGDVLRLMPEVVQGVETLHGAGGGKRKHGEAMGIALRGFSEAGGEVRDYPAFVAGLGLIVDGVVACLRASVWKRE